MALRQNRAAEPSDYEAAARAEWPGHVTRLRLALDVEAVAGRAADAAIARLGAHDSEAEAAAEEAMDHFYEALMAVINCTSVFATAKDFSAYLDRIVAAAAEAPT